MVLARHVGRLPWGGGGRQRSPEKGGAEGAVGTAGSRPRTAGLSPPGEGRLMAHS